MNILLSNTLDNLLHFHNQYFYEESGSLHITLMLLEILSVNTGKFHSLLTPVIFLLPVTYFHMARLLLAHILVYFHAMWVP